MSISSSKESHTQKLHAYSRDHEVPEEVWESWNDGLELLGFAQQMDYSTQNDLSIIVYNRCIEVCLRSSTLPICGSEILENNVATSE